MISFLRRASVGLGFAAAGLAHPIHAQANPSRAVQCGQAAQVLRTTRPGDPRRQEPFGLVHRCPDTAAVVVSEVWREPSERDGDRLWAATIWTRDARVTRAVLDIVTNRSASAAVRVIGMRALATQLDSLVILNADDFARALAMDTTGRRFETRVSHPVSQSGSQPVTPALGDEVLRTLADLERNDPDPDIRRAARVTRRQFYPRRSPPQPRTHTPASRPACGSVPLGSDVLGLVTRYFTDPEYAGMRDSLIVRQPAAAHRSVITDSATCVRALDATLATLRDSDLRYPELQQHGYEHAVMEFGPYTLVVIKPDADAPSRSLSEFIPCFVYRTSGLRLLTVWLV